MNFCIRRELRKINNIEVKEPDKKREFFKKVKSKAEDCLFSVIGLLPEKLMPGFVMEWVSRYIDKRMNELQKEQTQANWKKVYTEKAVEELKRK